MSIEDSKRDEGASWVINRDKGGVGNDVQRLLAAVSELRFSKQEQESVESSLHWIGHELSVVQPESRPRVLEMFWDRVKLPAPELKRLRDFVSSQVATQMMEQD